MTVHATIVYACGTTVTLATQNKLVVPDCPLHGKQCEVPMSKDEDSGRIEG